MMKLFSVSNVKSKNSKVVEKWLLSLSRFPIIASPEPVGKSALLYATVGRRPKHDLDCTRRMNRSGSGIICPTPHFHISRLLRDHPSVTERALRTWWPQPQRLYFYFCFVPSKETRSRYNSTYMHRFNCYALFKQMSSIYSNIFVFFFKYFLLKVSFVSEMLSKWMSVLFWIQSQYCI